MFHLAKKRPYQGLDIHKWLNLLHARVQTVDDICLFVEEEFNFIDRLSVAAGNVGCYRQIKGDCVGGAFFVAGMIPYDAAMNGDNFRPVVDSLLSKCKVLDRLEDDVLIVTRKNRKISHMAYVENAEDEWIYHRQGTGMLFTITKGLESLNYYTQYSDSALEYYKPYRNSLFLKRYAAALIAKEDWSNGWCIFDEPEPVRLLHREN